MRSTISFVLVTAFLCAVCSAQDFAPPARGLRINEPAALKNQYPSGMPHGVALFGRPHYGKSLTRVQIFDAMNNTEMTGCDGWKADPSWGLNFIVMVNRGKCRFTEKVAYAERQGAAAVIVKDNVLLEGEPASYCSDYSKPITDSGAVCLARDDYSKCKCEATNSRPTPLPSVPQCSDQTTAIYEATDCRNEKAPCWACPGTNQRHPLSCIAEGRNCLIESAEPFMADDSTGGSIGIPAFIVSDFDGENIRQAILKGPTYITMSWDVVQRTEVNYELWTSSEDHNGAEFKRDFQDLAIDLSSHTSFRPRYFIYKGSDSGCLGGRCGSLCILNGRYCGPDPDGDLYDKISGADVVKENLRQICIYKTLTEAGGNDAAKTKELQQKWWCYVNDFANDCYGEDGPMDSSLKFDQCARTQMKKVGIDEAAVDKCINDAGGVTCTKPGNECQVNSLLETEIKDRLNYNMRLPSIVVNGVLLRTASVSGGAMEQTVAEAICNSFAGGFAPQRCDQILNPMGVGNAGIASVTFTVEVSSDAGSSFVYDAHISNRLQNTLSLKLGVNRFSIVLGRPSMSPGKATLEVRINRLMCSDKVDETETVTQLLNKVNKCEQDVESATEASKELDSLSGRTFYFHNYVQATGITHVIAAKISNPTKGCDAHGGAKGKAGGVSVVVFVIVVLALVAGGIAGGLVWYNRVRNDMKDQVQSILAQYQPLEEIASKGRDESETAAML